MASLAALLDAAAANLGLTAAAVFVATTLVLVASSWLTPTPPPLALESAPVRCGAITAAELARHDGSDPFRPLYLAIQGVVYDVTTGRSFYGPGAKKGAGGQAGRWRRGGAGGSSGARAPLSDAFELAPVETALGGGARGRPGPRAARERRARAFRPPPRPPPAHPPPPPRPRPAGGGYAVFAGKEVARALATMSLKPGDLNGDLSGCTDKELGVLAEWRAKLSAKYAAVGRVVAPLELTVEELRKHDGSDKSRPMLLAIRGAVYDVSDSKDFYGPDGIYPFAGRECARAFALVSTDVADCVPDVSGLGAMEMDNLAEWTAKFDFKYKKVGRVVA